MGRFSSEMPLLPRRMALPKALMPCSWPTTRWLNFSSIFSNFLASSSINLVTGMPVQRETTWATSSSVTSSFNKWLFFWRLRNFLSSAPRVFFNSGIFPYFNSATFWRSAVLWAMSISLVTLSISSLSFLILEISSFSEDHLARKLWAFSFKSAKVLWITRNRFWSPFSPITACFSISSFWISLLKASNSSGSDSISNLKPDAASSIKSTALSGKNLSEIKRLASSAAALRAASLILIPWWSSYLSLSPLKMATVSSTDGSAT